MFKAKILIPFSLLLLFLYFILVVRQPPAERQKIQFIDPIQSVQDSMQILIQICDTIRTEPNGFMSLVVRPNDGVLYYSGESVGKLDSVTASNEAFKKMRTAHANRLLLVVKFLNLNFINGIRYEGTVGCWLYAYRSDVSYSDRYGIRSLYLLKRPGDVPQRSLKQYWTILDRKGRILLLSHT
jgi:hypothetical protein